MNALEALHEALSSGGNKIARPLSWQGTGRGIIWSASNAQSPMPWRQGWIVVPRTSNAVATLPDPEHLFDDWETTDNLTLRAELHNRGRPAIRCFQTRSPTWEERFPT